MHVTLTPEFEQLVARKVESGRYHSAAEVVHEGLRLLEEQDRLQEMRRDDLRREVARGVEQADRGELVPSETVFQTLRERNRQATEAAAQSK